MKKLISILCFVVFFGCVETGTKVITPQNTPQNNSIGFSWFTVKIDGGYTYLGSLVNEKDFANNVDLKEDIRIIEQYIFADTREGKSINKGILITVEKMKTSTATFLGEASFNNYKGAFDHRGVTTVGNVSAAYLIRSHSSFTLGKQISEFISKDGYSFSKINKKVVQVSFAKLGNGSTSVNVSYFENGGLVDNALENSKKVISFE